MEYALECDSAIKFDIDWLRRDCWYCYLPSTTNIDCSTTSINTIISQRYSVIRICQLNQWNRKGSLSQTFSSPTVLEFNLRFSGFLYPTNYIPSGTFQDTCPGADTIWSQCLSHRKDLGYFHANGDWDMSTTAICYFSLLMAHYVCFLVIRSSRSGICWLLWWRVVVCGLECGLLYILWPDMIMCTWWTLVDDLWAITKWQTPHLAARNAKHKQWNRDHTSTRCVPEEGF